MAHKMGAGSTRNCRDSQAKRLGIKCIGTQKVEKGYILVRQRGTKIRAGNNVGIGKDHTLYANRQGIVHYTYSKAGYTSVSIVQPIWNRVVTDLGYTNWESLVESVCEKPNS
jgi:large subunit ribosomal protein L27